MTNNIDALLDKAFADYNTGHFDVAEELARQALSLSPSNGDALYLLGLIAYQAGAYEPASQLLYQAVQLYPDSVNYVLALAATLQKEGRLDEALSYYEKHKDSPAVLTQIGLIYAARGQNDWANSAFVHSLELQPYQPEAMLGLAALAKRNGDFDKAKEILKDAESHCPTADVYHQLSVLYRMQDNLPRALSYINNALQLLQTPVYLNEKGLILESMGDNDAALDAYMAATRSNIYFADTFCNQGNIYVKQNQLSLAEDAYKRAIALDPKFLQAHHNLASILYRIGRKGEALDHYQEAVIINPKHAPSVYNLAVILEDLGEYSEAAGLYFNALALGYTNDTLDFRIAATLDGLYCQSKEGQKQAKNFAKGWVKNFPDNEVAKHALDTFSGKRSADMLKYAERLYNAFAPEYEDTMSKLEAQTIATAVQMAGDKEYHHTLDLACGTGLFGTAFHHKCHTLTGVDISQKMLDLAQSTHIYEKLVHSSVGAFLSSDTQTYDLIVALELSGYLDTLPLLFDQVATHLTKDGIFLFSGETPFEHQEQQLAPNGRYLYDALYVETLLRDAKMKVIETQTVNMRKEGTGYASGYVLKAVLDN